MNIKVKQKEKLIKFLIHNIQGMSFGSAQKSIRLGKIKINGKRTKENIELAIGDTVDVFESKKSLPTVPIIYSDDNILIVNKPAGLECATRDKSSANTYSLEEIFEKDNAIVVHRLDRLTEGLVILAKTKAVATKFEEYFRLRKIDKFYRACVSGKVPRQHETLVSYLKKDSQKSEVKICDTPQEGYKEIITEYTVNRVFENYTLLDIHLHTGRTHQIRAHLSHIGHGILGDEKYNRLAPNPHPQYKGYYLTSCELRFHLDDDMKYLNDIHLIISPSWEQYL